MDYKRHYRGQLASLARKRQFDSHSRVRTESETQLSITKRLPINSVPRNNSPGARERNSEQEHQVTSEATVRLYFNAICIYFAAR